MQSAVVLLERSSWVPKAIWRDHGFHRTLAPIEVSHLIANAWKSNQTEVAETGSIRMSLHADGSAKEPSSLHPMQASQRQIMGVFDVSFISIDQAKVTLREEECARRLGSPKRRTRQIALLRPWKPVRVLLNGRYASYSGQHYALHEFHLALCYGAPPEQLDQPRLIDLQADLF